ncbi:MFS transporter [Arthrobacter sp. HS15c]|uniref:MFS transporter n=1 Tax=Arthrobacter sp. HS15c TaxID=3230279 RepID=UPI0034652FD8
MAPLGAETESGNPQQAQRRIVAALVAGQVLGGIGMGAALSIGSLLAVQVSGSTAWSGMAATMNTLGAALLAIPLARIAAKKGRRVSLSLGTILSGLGAGIAITAASLSAFPLLLVGLALLGSGTAVNFQARFAATDMAAPSTRARDLSIVVWSTTIGAVSGPNLFEPGEVFGRWLHLPPLTGAFAFTVAAQLAAAAVYALALRPDPLKASLYAPKDSRRKNVSGFTVLRRRPALRFAVAAVALTQGTMVALMSMTPVHLHEHGAGPSVVGFTLSLHIAGMFGLSPVFGWLADRLGRLPILLGGQGMLLASLTFAWLAPQTMVTPSLILLGLGWSAAVVAGSAMVADAVTAEERSGLQGVSDLIMNLVGASCGALAGPVLAAVGYSGLGTVAMSLVAVVLAWALLNTLRKRGS